MELMIRIQNIGGRNIRKEIGKSILMQSMIGLAVFFYCERVAMTKGLMAHY